MGREIGDYIRIVRKFRKMTQEQLAKAIGVNRSLISKYEKNMIEPSVKQLKKISEILGVDIFDMESKTWDLEDDEVLMFLNGELKLDESKAIWIHSGNGDSEKEKLMEVGEESVPTDDEMLKITCAAVSSYMEKMNRAGQAVAVQTVKTLADMPEYQKKDEPGQE